MKSQEVLGVGEEMCKSRDTRTICATYIARPYSLEPLYTLYLIDVHCDILDVRRMLLATVHMKLIGKNIKDKIRTSRVEKMFRK